jgi:hypothetical protein
MDATRTGGFDGHGWMQLHLRDEACAGSLDRPVEDNSDKSIIIFSFSRLFGRNSDIFAIIFELPV